MVGKTLYISVPFTWQIKEAEQIAKDWKGKVLIGGSGMMEPNQCEGFEPLLFHNPCATFTTRGCPNACGFCAVNQLEPDFYEIPGYRPAPVLCDNNFTAASRKHQELVVEKQKVFRLTDFNQGLEAKRFTPELADLLGKIHCKVRFSFDSWGEEAAVKDAVDLCKERTTKNIGIYCLIGYNDTPESARARLELVRSWGLLSFPMRYQPLATVVKNSFVAPNWTDLELKNMTRYYSRLLELGFIPWEEYRHRKESSQSIMDLGNEVESDIDLEVA